MPKAPDHWVSFDIVILVATADRPVNAVFVSQRIGIDVRTARRILVGLVSRRILDRSPAAHTPGRSGYVYHAGPVLGAIKTLATT